MGGGGGVGGGTKKKATELTVISCDVGLVSLLLYQEYPRLPYFLQVL